MRCRRRFSCRTRSRRGGKASSSGSSSSTSWQPLRCSPQPQEATRALQLIDVFSAATQATAEQLRAERERLATELGAAAARADDAVASASQGQAEQWRQQLDDAQHKLQLALRKRDQLQQVQQVRAPRACRLHSLAPTRLSSALLPFLATGGGRFERSVAG